MTRKIPRGDENLICRYHKLPMSEVCHTCDSWTHLQGRNPNTGEIIDDWKCADSWIPVLLLEIAQKAHGVSAEIGSLRGEMGKAHEEAMSAARGVAVMTALPMRGAPRLLETKNSSEGD